ncbi:DinB family protein [Pedobacter sp. UYP1]|uniref:DinB family protein n=1 Tax=Pedobacter sp. UYP1 TaxID=1756396 RepID=UPI00339A557A
MFARIKRLVVSFGVIVKLNADIRLSTLIHKYDFHTVLTSKVINGIETLDLSLLGNDANKIPLLVGSQVKLRFELAKLLGVDEVQNADILFRFNKGIQFNMGYPSLKPFNLEWKKISSILRTEILELDNEDLFTYSQDDPEMKGIFFDLLSGIIEREASIISILTILI